MKKLIYFGTMLFLLGSCASSEIDDINPPAERSVNPHRVSLSQALNTAEQMFSSVPSDKPAVRSGRSVASVSYMVEPAVRNTESIDTALYIVNYKGGGFALLAADDRLDNVYAISEEGSLSMNDTVTNPGLKLYMDMLDKHISERASGPSRIIIDPGVPILPPPTVPQVYLHTACNPRLSAPVSRFHQNAPFNKYYDAAGIVHQVICVGCLPLAMSMITAYHKWPESIDGLSIDWNYIWSNGYHNILGYFLQRIGKYDYLNASYSEDGTSASTAKVIPVFKKLGYTSESNNMIPFSANKTTSLLGRTYHFFISENYIDGDSRAYIDGSPVIIVGSSSVTSSCHAWVIDGYRIYDVTGAMNIETPEDQGKTFYDTYLHCVWGWGSLNNGYYKWTDTYKFEGKPDEFDSNDNSYYCKDNMHYDYGFIMTDKLTPNK